MLTRGPFLRTVTLRDDHPVEAYPYGLPAIADLDLAFGPVTMLVGDNGTGKSTLTEAIAVAAGFNAEGGSRNLRFETTPTHSDLHRHLDLRWRQRPRWGWFLRAETFYGMATHVSRDGELAAGLPSLHDRSHGESFLDLIDSRFDGVGLYVMDEPESALSFQGQLRLLRIIRDRAREGSQFLIATHSPILMRAADATIYEFADHGVRSVEFDDVVAVGLWRRFLDDPDPILDVLYADDEDER
ncbi:MAG: AAA family ATPase [Desertimonas sp.]